MYPFFPYGLTMTLIKRTVSGTDDYGNDVYSENPVSVRNCVFQPAGSTENLIFTDQVSETDVIFMPSGTDVDSLDAIDFNGERFEIMGDPQTWSSPFSGRVSPVRLNVSRITGVAV